MAEVPSFISSEFTLILVDVLGTGSSNNYAYLVKDDKTNDAVIIDPANPSESVRSSGSHKTNI